MHRPSPGRYVTVTTAGEPFQAFVPLPLPPAPQGVSTANALLALVKATRLTPATVNKSLVHLERIGVVGELTNRQRGRVFSSRRYVDELAAGLEEAA
jgi:hypothetical protein